MKTQTYYQQIKAAVLPDLQWYRNDLLELDRKALRNYTGALIHAHRDCGTDLILLDKLETARDLEFAHVFTFRAGNSGFLYGNGYDGIIRPVSRKFALGILLNVARTMALKAAPYHGRLTERCHEIERDYNRG